MKNETLKYVIGGVILGGIAVWLITVSAISSGNSGMMRMVGLRTATDQGTTRNAGVLDGYFIQQMIPHHEDAITMAKLAQTKARHPEIKQLAENIIDSQSKEIHQMKSWYQDWFGEEVPAGDQVMNQHGMMGESTMHMGMMGDVSDMTRLEQAEEFDKAFIEQMIPHHQMAVMMANMLLQGTTRLEMKQLAQDIITAQTKEINQMRQWYSDWGYAQ